MGLQLGTDRSIIPACDGDFDRFIDIVRGTHDIGKVSSYKIGAALCLSVGVATVVKAAREITDKPLIYDHQKAGTDIPDTAGAFMEALASAGVQAVILFPLAGPDTQAAWTTAAQASGLVVIVGGYMTHPQFLSSEGGYVSTEATDRIFGAAANQGVTDFVVPGNKPEVIRRVRQHLAATRADIAFFAPGLIRQGGRLSDAARVAGPRWHAIIGRALYESTDIRREAVALTAHI